MNARSTPARVVLGIDGSDTARAAARFVAALPLPPGTDVLLLSVIEDVLRPHEIEELAPEQRDAFHETAGRTQAEVGELLESEAALLRESGHAVTTEIRSGHPAAEIVAAAAAHGADLIAVGSHGLTGIARFLLGSVSSQVFRFARRSVLIVRKPELGREGGHARPPALSGHPWRILIAFDGSAPSLGAVDFCTSLNLDGRMSVRLLGVLPMVTMFRQDIRQELDGIWQQRKQAQLAALQGAADRFVRSPAAVTTALTEAGDVGEAILAAGDEFDAHLIVLGHKGRGAVESFLTGSITPQVVHHARRSVLVVR